MLLKADYHLHPLAHTYRHTDPEARRQLSLTREDKHRIQAVVDWCVHERQLDAFAITDHDMLQSSLYAAEYTKSKYSAHCVCGAELEARIPNAPPGKDWVHILAYNISRLPAYTESTPLDTLLAALRQQGAFIVMAHPVMYPRALERYAGQLDGYESQSGTTPPFTGGHRYPMLQQYQNSDFHYKGAFPRQNQHGVWASHSQLGASPYNASQDAL